MDKVAEFFKISDSSTCILGGTIIDIDVKSGHNKESMEESEGFIYPKTGLFLYPVIKEIQNSETPDSFSTSLMSTWINGFIPNSNSLGKTENNCTGAVRTLQKASIVKTEQILLNKKEELIATLFSYFRFYNQNEPILNLDDSYTKESKEKLIRKGLVCENWEINKPQIRYMVRKLGDKDIPDYLYLIGGSDELICDKPSDTINFLKNLYINNIGENINLWNLDKKEVTGFGLWKALDVSNLNINNISKSDICNTIMFLRTITGIIFIRNYLLYANMYMGINTIIEFNGDSPKNISITKLLTLYEEVYQYCKTITNLLCINKTGIATIL